MPGSTGVTTRADAGVQGDLVDEQLARTAGAFDADRQLRDLLHAHAGGGQIDRPGQPGRDLQVGRGAAIEHLGAVDLEVELAAVVRVAEEVERQALAPVLGPVLRRVERPLGLGVGRPPVLL